VVEKVPEAVTDVHAVLDGIKAFTAAVRSGARASCSGKPFTSFLAVGIGGSYLGPFCVHTALKNDPVASVAAAGKELRFLANVDPVGSLARHKRRGIFTSSFLKLISFLFNPIGRLC
jgi:glucose-6-phosphate isomerase